MGAQKKEKRKKPDLIISDREVNRYARAEVALVRWKRLKRKWSVESCAEPVGVSPKTWRNVEHGRHYPNERTLIRMRVGVNLTPEEILETLMRRKIKHLRRIEARKNSSNRQG